MTQSDCYRREDCRLCGSHTLTEVVQLTATPPGNHFVDADAVGKPQKAYPLNLNFCEDCHHVQLSHVVDPVVLFQSNYSFVSGTSPVNVKHFEDYAADTVRRHGLQASDLVVDIGSNDGTCLLPFKRAGMSVFGVEPAGNIAAIAEAAGIPTLADFFNEDTAKKVRSEKGSAKLITTHNVCAHIDDLASVMRGVSALLADDGIFIMEVGYFLDVFEKVWFDTIYHEHTDFHTVAPLIGFFEQYGLQMVHAERTAPQGGSIRMTMQRQGGVLPVDASVAACVQLEKDAGLNRAETLRDYASRIDAVRDALKAILGDLKAAGKRIAGYGAPTKATTLMGHFGITAAEIDFLVDDNPLKQNRFTPGSHIPVYSAEAIYTEKPDYLLILAWNFAEPIMQKHKEFAESGGQFIIPMPEARIISGA